MEQDAFMLLAAAVLGTLATLFAIIGVATRAWTGSNIGLFNLVSNSERNFTAAGVLLIIAIVILAIAILFTVMFLKRLINKSSDKIKFLVLALFILAVIFIVSAYSRAVAISLYSYHLTVTAGALAFLSTIFFTYWLGRASVTV